MNNVIFRKAIDGQRHRVSVTAKDDGGSVLFVVSEKDGPGYGQMFVDADAVLPLYRLMGLYLDKRPLPPSPTSED